MTQSKLDAAMSYLKAKQAANCRGGLIMRKAERVAVVMRDSGKLILHRAKSRTVVIATENPVPRYCERRYQQISEVLLMSGIEWRDPQRRQLPIVDSHDSSSVRNVLGSIRNCRIDGQRLVGEVYWARSKRAQDAAGKWADDHLRNFSVTAAPLEVMEVGEGQQWKGVKGPADIVVRWTPLDASIVACGADWTAFMPQEHELTAEQVATSAKQWWQKESQK